LLQRSHIPVIENVRERPPLGDQDAPRLREAAHKSCGMLSEFSTVAGDLAGSLEEPTSGQVLVAGSDLSGVSPKCSRRNYRALSE